MTGFNIYRNARPPTPTTITRTQNLQAGATQTYRTSIPTRTPEVSQTTTLVNAPDAVILSSGFNVVGPNTVYSATVRSPSLPGFQGRVQFQFRVQKPAGLDTAEGRVRHTRSPHAPRRPRVPRPVPRSSSPPAAPGATTTPRSRSASS